MSEDAENLLREARRLVERGWARQAEARDEAGDAVDPWEQSAVSWSLLGSIVAAVEHHARRHKHDLPLEELSAALHELAFVVDDDSLADWNDRLGRTQADVAGVLDDAANAAARHVPQQESG